jgi:hypothetical protein
MKQRPDNNNQQRKAKGQGPPRREAEYTLIKDCSE